jgi:tetratricopeptide (TPR) repeat protein
VVSDTRAEELARRSEHRDQALRDILALEEQVRLGEIPPTAADILRRGYERAAAQALTGHARTAARGPAPRPRRAGRVIAYLLAAAVAVLAAAVVLPRYIAARPANGFVTGNEPMQSMASQPSPAPENSSPSSTVLPPSSGTDSSLTTLTAAVAANPNDDNARLSLANRYTDDGDYTPAAQQYLTLLQRDPANAEARAHYSWLLLQTGSSQPALAMIRQALTQDPTSLHALWFLANIQVYGLGDGSAALTTLRQLQQHPHLPADLANQIPALTAIAARQAGQR